MPDRAQSDLLRLRKAAGLTRRQLSEMSGICARTIIAVELNQHGIRPSTQAALCHALGVGFTPPVKEPTEPPPKFSMRCRWCGHNIDAIVCNKRTGRLTTEKKKFAVYNGWFYHIDCLSERTRIKSPFK